MNGFCKWCKHPKRLHNGKVDPKVKSNPTYTDVKWTVTACGMMSCACRTYAV